MKKINSSIEITNIRKDLARDIRTMRRSGNRAGAKLLASANRAGWTCAHRRARFLRGAILPRNAREKKATTISCGPGKKRAVVAWEGGNGGHVENQLLLEMYYAARAAYMGGFRTARGKSIPPGIKAASAAAWAESHQATREPVFSDIKKAENAARRAAKARAEIANNETLFSFGDFSDSPEFRENDVEIIRSISRARLAAGVRAAKRALVAYWKTSQSRKAKSALMSDCRKLRALIKSAQSGFAPLPPREENTRRVAMIRLSERISAGREVLANKNRPALQFELRELQNSLQ